MAELPGQGRPGFFADGVPMTRERLLSTRIPLGDLTLGFDWLSDGKLAHQVFNFIGS
tara:strand:- start:899 stop:1069 length:171 start_codon:yes stop_codon:yes gene_type:complete